MPGIAPGIVKTNQISNRRHKMAKIVFYPRRITYTFFYNLRHKERIEVSVADDKIHVVNSHVVRIDTSVLKEIGVVDKHAEFKGDWSFWCKDMVFGSVPYPREIDLILTGE